MAAVNPTLQAIAESAFNSINNIVSPTELKPIENTNSEEGFVKTTIKLGVNTLNASDLKFTLAERIDYTERPYGNLFSSLNLPIIPNDIVKYTATTSVGIFTNTAFSGFNQDKIIIVEIPKSEYGELIDGKSIYLKLPITSGGTDITIDCYSTFFYNGGLAFDTRLSDPIIQSGEYGSIRPNSVNGYISNVSYIFSDSISTPKRASGLTWNGVWSNTNKFNVTTNGTTGQNGKELATYRSTQRFGSSVTGKTDTPIGIAYLDKGFFVITHPDIVNNFPYTAATSSGYDGIIAGQSTSGITDGKFTQIYFSDITSASTSFNSIITEYIQNITANALPNEFYESNNPTFAVAYPEGNEDNDPVYITEIGLYNEYGELIAIGKTSEPIPKTKDNYALFNIQLKV
jgi:hypothetical protein